MTEKKTVIYDIDPREDHKTNPFLRHIKLKDRTELHKVGDASNLAIIDKDSKKTIESHIVYASETTYDKSKFIKFYEGSIGIVSDLPTAARKVFTFIIDNKVEYGRDKIELTIEECVRTLSMSAPSVYRGIGDLQDSHIIAKRKDFPNTYFINPNLFYWGERRFLLM